MGVARVRPGAIAFRSGATEPTAIRFHAAMTEQKERNWLTNLGGEVSSWGSGVAAHPFAQIGFVVLCIAWFVGGWNVNLLTAALSILAITLTQMVLNRQNEREID